MTRYEILAQFLCDLSDAHAKGEKFHVEYRNAREWMPKPGAAYNPDVDYRIVFEPVEIFVNKYANKYADGFAPQYRKTLADAQDAASSGLIATHRFVDMGPVQEGDR